MCKKICLAWPDCVIDMPCLLIIWLHFTKSQMFLKLTFGLCFFSSSFITFVFKTLAHWSLRKLKLWMKKLYASSQLASTFSHSALWHILNYFFSYSWSYVFDDIRPSADTVYVTADGCNLHTMPAVLSSLWAITPHLWPRKVRLRGKPKYPVSTH